MRLGSIVQRSPWAILESKLEDIRDVILRHDAGVSLTADEIALVMEGASGQGGIGRTQGAVAVLPITGVIAPKVNVMSEMSGGTSVDRLTKAFRAAQADPDIDAIVFDVNSPGGSVEGIPELAGEILAARGRKPMVAVANYLMASAAYWLSAGADEIVVSPSASVGSIGVLTMHTDISEALAKDGIKVSIKKRGAYKAEGNRYEPLGEDAHARIDVMLDQMYRSFVGHLAAARGQQPSDEDIDAGTAFGGGRVFLGSEALEQGMADRVATLDQVITGLLAPQPAGRHRADLDAARVRLALSRA